MQEGPLVSIGIPTYNRPEGLRRTLLAITRQTYPNLEIIVSDNNSENENVQIVLGEFAKNDPRIIAYRQAVNSGGYPNFKFVLEKATGQYFMWAADDDEWNERFIEEMLAIIGDHSAAFCNFAVKYRQTHTFQHIKVGQNPPGATRYEQAKNFLESRIPSMFYSLYKTEDIKWVAATTRIFDWFDCYSILKIILLFNGFAVADKELYIAGISQPTYQYKPVKASSKRVFSYSLYFRKSTGVILRSGLPFKEKLQLLNTLIQINFKTFLEIEKKRKSYKFYSFLYRVYNWISPPVGAGNNKHI